MSVSTKEKIVVIGTGYVGLPAALMLAKAGYQVLGVDLNENVVKAINDREMLIAEGELKKLMNDPDVTVNLSASTEVSPADIFIIAVPTPLHPRKKVADMSYVVSALESLCPHLKPGNLVIIESTIPPLSLREIAKPYIEAHTSLKVPDDVRMAHCPERILPGDIFYEIVHNDRIIGGMDEASSEAARKVYASFVEGELLLTDDVTAELCKLLENTYRDVNVALANQMAEVAEDLGVDYRRAFELANRHRRVDFLNPGIGVGGHCIPIDPWFIKEVDPINTQIIEVARRINDDQPYKIARKIRRSLASIETPRIVAVGASYKPNTEDARESPAQVVVDCLREDGYRVDHVDPLIPGMRYDSLEKAAEGADLLVVLVNHQVVQKELEDNRDRIKKAMRHPNIVVF